MMALHKARWHDGPPECLELVIFESTLIDSGPGLKTQTRWVAVRVPAEPSARQAAITAHQFYAAVEQVGEISNPQRVRTVVRVALVLASICLPLAALGLLMNAQGIMAGTPVPLLLALLGTLIGAGALATAGFLWAAKLRKR
jgi:hypothetical protein